MRPSNWSVLDLAHDPTPGDPVAVRAGGTRYVGIADAIGRAAATMRSLEAGVSNVDSVKALLESRDKVVDSVGVAEGRYRAAGQALSTYATVLDRVQADTLQALHAARAAAGDGAEASDDQAKFHERAQDAKDAGDADEQEKWEKKEDAAKSAGSHAAGAVAAQKRVVEQAVDDRDAAARTAIEAITASTSNDGLNDTWWDDWGAKLTEWIAKIAEAIATIAGILALIFCWVPILGEVLMIIAAVAGIVAALANIILAATGEKSWGEAALSVVFAVLGCIGVGAAFRALGGAAKAGMALKGGAEAATATKATGDALATVAARVRRGEDVIEDVADVEKAALPNEITAADKAALADYTGPGYWDLNSALRGKTSMTPALQTRVDAVSTALSKLPDHTGTVYRGTELSQETIASYVVGEVKVDPAFVSTSVNAAKAFPGNTLFIVDSAAGKAVTEFSMVPHEAEILFDKGSSFMVTSNQFSDVLKKVVITLKEVTE